MLKCERCGAMLALDREQCAYCGTVSLELRARLQAEATRRIQEASQATALAAITQRKATLGLERSASLTLTWGLLSVLFVCLPVPSVAALVQYSRVRKTAQGASVEVPTRATVGGILGAFSLLAFFGLFTWMVIDIHADTVRMEARKAALTQQLASRINSPVLDHDLACGLAEIYLLTNGFGGSTNTGAFHDLDCAGAVRTVKERAELPDFKLHTSSTGDAVTATICFKHGARWFVESAGTTPCALDQR